MKKSNKIIIVVLVIIILVGCGIGAYFLWRNRTSDGPDGNLGMMSSRYDGMYYYYLSGTYYKSEYIKLKGNQWVSSDGDSGTYRVDGTDIALYKSVMGDDEVILSGTIDNGVITVKQDIAGIPMNVYYCQDGKTPNN